MTIIKPNNLYKTILFTTILIFSATLATASPADLFLFPEEADTRIDSFAEYQLEIENKGNTDDVYTLSSPESEVTIAPTRVPREGNLAPGETKTVNVWYNPESDAEEGRNSFTVEATSRASGETYSVTGVANVIKDYNTQIEVEPSSQTTCRGETATYDVTVSNTGIQPDEVQIETERGELQDEQFNLDVDESRTTTLEVTEDEEMAETFDVKASSKSVSYAHDTQSVDIDVETCYDSQLTIEPEELDTAAYTTGTFDVELENLGTRTDLFELETDRGELSETEVELDSGENELVELEYRPEELGTKDFEVTAEGVSSTSDTAQMNVYNGMDVQTTMPEERTICEEEQTNLTATVENTGEAADQYNLETNQGNLTTEEISLDVGESEEVNISFDAQQFEEETTEDVELTATSQTFEETSDTANKEVFIDNCWDLEMEMIPEVQSAGENRSVVYEIDLENTGSKNNTYMLDYDGPEWISIQPKELALDPSERDTAYMYAGIPFDKEEAEVTILVKAEGYEVYKEKTVQLKIGDEEIEEIRSPVDRITGDFLDRTPDVLSPLREAGTLVQVILSVLTAAAITVFILYRE